MRDLDESRLVQLLVQSRQWLADHDQFRLGLSTKAALTEWHALVRKEEEMVRSITQMINDELALRNPDIDLAADNDSDSLV